MSRELLAAYLVVGQDELKAKEVVARLKRRLEPGLEAFNLDERVVPADVEAPEILSSLNTMPFGSGFRLVLIHDADRIPKPTSEALVSYLADPNPGCVLCLVAERLAKTTRLYKAVARLGNKAIIECAPASRRELPKRVARMAQVKGIRMNVDACEQLIALVGESTTMLDTQVATLAEFCRNAGVITRADVDRYVTRIAEVKPWELADAVSNRDAARALELYELMQSPSEVYLTSLLAGRMRELICAKSLAARGQAALVAETLGKQGWQVRNYGRWAGRFAAGELEAALDACARCDRALKSGADVRTAFVDLVLAICGRGALVRPV